MRGPLSATEQQTVAKAAAEKKSRDIHKAANLLAQASQLMFPYDKGKSGLLFNDAKRLRESAELALTVDGEG